MNLNAKQIFFYDQLKLRKDVFIGIDKGLEFLTFFKSEIKKDKVFFANTTNSVVLFDLHDFNYQKMYYSVEKEEFKEYFDYKFREFVINFIFMKTFFSLNLMFFLKKMKVSIRFKPKKKIGFTKKLLNLILISLLESCQLNENCFDEIIFCNNLKENLFEVSNADYLYVEVKNLFSSLKKKKIFFSLERNKFSIKSNSFYILFSNLNVLISETFINDYFSAGTEIEFDFFFFNKKMNDQLIINIDENIFNLIFVLSKKFDFKIDFEKLKYDYYNIDLFQYNDLIQDNTLTLKALNTIFNTKFFLNKVLYYATISSFFNYYIFDSKYNLFFDKIAEELSEF